MHCNMGKILEFLSQGKISVDLIVFGMRPIYAELMFTSLSIRGVIRVSNSFDPDQARRLFGPDLGQTVCKSYQRTTLATLR